jgi:hypothetical protein
MRADLSPLRLLLVTLAGWVNRHQQQVIEYLVEENHVLKEQLKGRCLRLTDDNDLCASTFLLSVICDRAVYPAANPR